MRRLKVAYRSDAIADLANIYRFILLRSQNQRVARDFVQRIKARCKRIGMVPRRRYIS